MTRKYLNIVRSTTACLEMKESDIMSLGKMNLAQATLPINQLPKHITPPQLKRHSEPATINSYHPSACHLKSNKESQSQGLNYKKTRPKHFVDLDKVNLLPEAKNLVCGSIS